jgi:AraC-like DNA-binding protein
MRSTDLLVPARYYARIGEVLARDHIELADLLREMDIPPQALNQPEAMIRFSLVDRLLVRLLEVTGRSEMAFELGKLLTANSHSFVGFGMLNSRTLDQALRFEAQYFRLIMPSFRMRYTSGADFGEMHFTPTVAMSHVCLTFHLEAIGMAALREITDLTGEQRPPCRLMLSIPEPPHASRYQALRDVSVRFAADSLPSVRLRILADPRAHSLAMADANARELAESRCRALVQKVAGTRQFADWVSMTLSEVSEALPSLPELAATLNISPRTLNRYLEREGTSFRELAGRIQHQLACERLSAGSMSVTEVAYSLGFTDTSNFARAFRARAGCSPGAFQHLRAVTADHGAPPKIEPRTSRSLS